MSITAATKIITTSAISTVPHAVDIPEYIDPTHLKVYECEDSTAETVHSVPTLLSTGDNYTVSQNEDGTGTVTITARETLDTNATIVVINDPPVERTVELIANGRIDVDALEETIDSLVLQIKLLQFQMARAIRFDHTALQAGVDNVAPLQVLPALSTDEATDLHFLMYDRTTGTFLWKDADEIAALMT